MKTPIATLAVCVLLFGACLSASAATVIFENGDRLTGDVVECEDGSLLIRTAHLGTVQASMKDVASIDDGAEILVEAPDAIEAEIAVLGEEEVASPWSGQVELGAHYSSGNTDRRGFHAGILAVRETEATRFEGKLGALYAQEDGDRTVNEQYLSLRDDIKFLPWYAFGLLTFERDEFQDLDFRVVFSPGLGRWLADGEKFKAKIEAGPAFTWTQYDDDSEFDVEARIGFWAEAHVLDAAKITEDLQIFPSLTDFGEFRLVSETSFEQPLSKELFFKLSLLFDYDSAVPDGVERHDFKALLSLVYKF